MTEQKTRGARSLCLPVLAILAAHIIRCLVVSIREKRNPLGIVSWPYAIISIAMAAGMIIRRHHEYWPILMTVIAGVYAFRMLFWERRAKLFGNIAIAHIAFISSR